MTGSIRCNKCGIAMYNGACPKCFRDSCHINLSLRGKTYKFYKDMDGILLSHESAIDMLRKINTELTDKDAVFCIDNWMAGKNRKVEKIIDLWIADCKAGVSAGTVGRSIPAGYLSISRNHILNDSYGIGSFQIQDVKDSDIRKFAESLPTSLKASSCRSIMNALHTFFSWSHKKGFVNRVPLFPKINASGANSHIYFIESSGKIKIGYSRDIHRRMETLKTSCPERFNVLLIIDGGVKVESMLHDKFKDHYSHGEWFETHADIKDYIESNKHLCLKNSLKIGLDC